MKYYVAIWKKARLLLAIVVLIVLSFPSRVGAQNTQNFVIKSFDSAYILDYDDKKVSTLKVSENIVAEFPNYDQNHGILRALPQTYQNEDLDLIVNSVKNSQGQDLEYSSYKENYNLVLRIGSADKYVRGEQTYIIDYSMRNVIRFFGGHDELYWNVNGNQWEQPILSTSATIRMPTEIATRRRSEVRCYVGEYKSTSTDCNISSNDQDNHSLTFSSENLRPNENMSFVIGLEKGTFAPDYQAIRQKQMVNIVAGVLAIGLPALVLLLAFSKWYKHGRDDPGRGVIVPQYVTPKDFDPVLSQTLINDRFANSSISAAIIDLAVNKFIAIHVEEKKGMLWSKSTKYELELLQIPEKQTLSEKAVVDMLFSGNVSVGEKVSMSSLANKLYKDVVTLRNDTYTQLTDLGYFKHNPEKIKTKYKIIGIFMLVFSFGLIFLIEPLGRNGVLAVGLLIGLGISGVIVAVMSRYMPAKTAKGVEMKDYLLGLRDYIKLSEAERLKFLQSPEGVKQYGGSNDTKTQIKLFEKLLPYAMIFGLEKEWAKQFENIYSEPPDWYRGNMTGFNSAYLASSLGNFTSTSSTSFSPPSSSGSSGFSSGGSSGGGGGGGGGGGW